MGTHNPKKPPMTKQPSTTTTIKPTNLRIINKETRDKAIENISRKKDWDNFLKFCLKGEEIELSEVSQQIDSIEATRETTKEEQKVKSNLYKQYHKLKEQIHQYKNKITKNDQEIAKLEENWKVLRANIAPKGPYTKNLKMKIEKPPIIERMKNGLTLTQRNKTKEKEEKKKENNDIDHQLLDKISNEYIKDKKAFNDIPTVELRIKQLIQQQQISSDTEQTKKISNLLLSYEIQNKYLLQLLVENDRKNNAFQRNRPGDEQNPIQIDIDEQSMMSGIIYDSDNKNIGDKNDPDKSSPISKTDVNQEKQNISNNKRKGTPSMTTSPSRKHKIDNPYTTNQKIPGNKNDEFKTAQDLMKRNGNSTHQQDYQSIRLRVQFKINKKEKESLKNNLQDVLYQIMYYAKIYDNKASLLPWKTNSEKKPLNGDEVKLHNEDTLFEYIDAPNKELKSGNTFYQNGIHIKTDITILKFIDKWNNGKYNKDLPIEIKKNWIAAKPAEMQNYSEAYEIGFFMGTIERGDYTTFQKSLQEKYGKEVELSYQLINQQGITSKIWENARKTAEADFPNPMSKEHKRVKFSNAPSALVMYTTDVNKTRQIRSAVMKEYGRLKNGLWPEIEDGSRSRFIPLLPGYINNKKLFQNIKENLWTQSCMKAGDITFDLQLKDIHQPKDYLEGKTLEQVIHGITSKDRKGFPIFKHITRKWDKDTTKNELEIVVASCMIQEATIFMKGMRNNLVKKYGNKIIDHFNHDFPQYIPKRKMENKAFTSNLIESEKEYNDLMTSFCEKDKYTEILIEGMSIIKLNKEEKFENTQVTITSELPDTSTKGIKDKNKKEVPSMKSSQKQNLKNNITNDEIMSNIEKLDYAEWDDITVTNESTVVKAANEKEKNKVAKTMKKLKITTNEIEKWKNKNWDRYDKMIESHEQNEYNIIKIIVEEIMKDRHEKYKREKEENIMEHLMTISEENDINIDQDEIPIYQNEAEGTGTPTWIDESN